MHTVLWRASISAFSASLFHLNLTTTSPQLASHTINWVLLCCKFLWKNFLCRIIFGSGTTRKCVINCSWGEYFTRLMFIIYTSKKYFNNKNFTLCTHTQTHTMGKIIVIRVSVYMATYRYTFIENKSTRWKSREIRQGWRYKMYRNKAGMKTHKKTTLLQNNGGNERQEDYPIAERWSFQQWHWRRGSGGWMPPPTFQRGGIVPHFVRSVT